MFIHTVYFWQKPGTSAALREQLIADCRDLLGRIDSVKQLFAGPPAGTERDVVDNSYSVGLTVIFDGPAGHAVYQPHPLHQEFIARNKQHWERVQVYDHVC
jgi:Stress responsive A/B Barrel Domain